MASVRKPKLRFEVILEADQETKECQLEVFAHEINPDGSNDPPRKNLFYTIARFDHDPGTDMTEIMSKATDMLQAGLELHGDKYGT